MRTVAVIPAYNEGPAIAAVVREALLQVERVVVVDDASSDDTAQVAREAGADVLRHALQRGAGRATATGIQAALRIGADLIVTLDADGQHLPAEIPRLIAPLQEGKADMTLGCRVLERERMPRLRQAGNHLANLWTWLLFGIKVSDSQSGYRGLTRETALRLPLEARGYEFCSETLGAAARLKLRLVEVPVTVVYTDYSLGKGQTVLTSVKTLARIGRAGLRS
jgi:glycosyltransferase involved in cell wall biosynthesis